MATVTLKPGNIQPVWAGHPWVYAQAVARVEGGAIAGGVVEVRDPRGQFLGRGLYSPGSAIPVRLFTRDERVAIDGALLAARLERAIARRRTLGLPAEGTDAYRLVHGEGDDLPGLIVDRFGDVLVVQFATVGMKQREGVLLDALERLCAPRAIVDRSTAQAAKLERFEAASGVVRGDTRLADLDFCERGFRYRIPLDLGQKTGFYVDQRPLRAAVESLARGRRVLDTFAYVGAVSLAAVRGGATEVRAVDASATALETAAECAARNGYAGRVQWECGDAVEALARAGRHGGMDLVICDPPKLAPTRAARERALGAMRRLSASAARAVKPGGLLVISSCSAALGLDALTRVLALGARDVGLRPLVLERLHQGADHPVPAAFPEGLYLATLVAEIETL